jgi:hypothetical protein
LAPSRRSRQQHVTPRHLIRAACASAISPYGMSRSWRRSRRCWPAAAIHAPLTWSGRRRPGGLLAAIEQDRKGAEYPA